MRLVLLAALLAAPFAASAQPTPAFDLGRFLTNANVVADLSEVRFSTPSFDFLLFPPSGYDTYDVDGRYVVRDASGGVVGTSTMYGRGETSTPNIVSVRSDGLGVKIESAGAYTFGAEFEGDVVASVPVTVAIEGSDDPFDTRSMLRVDGPWRTHGYFIHGHTAPETKLEFHTWHRNDEPGGDERTEVSIRRGGEEVAFGSGNPNGTSDGWRIVEYELFVAADRDPQGRFGRRATNARPWSVDAVTPGTYEIVVSTETAPLRSFTVEGAAGAFTPHVRSDVNVEPRSLFLTPRRMTGQMLNRPAQLYWVGPETM